MNEKIKTALEVIALDDIPALESYCRQHSIAQRIGHLDRADRVIAMHMAIAAFLLDENESESES